jgi:hypothetical protein
MNLAGLDSSDFDSLFARVVLPSASPGKTSLEPEVNVDSLSVEIQNLNLNKASQVLAPLPLPVNLIGSTGPWSWSWKHSQSTQTIARFVTIVEKHPKIQTLTWLERHYENSSNPSGYNSTEDQIAAFTKLADYCKLSNIRELTLGYHRNLTNCAKEIGSITLAIVVIPNLEKLTLYMRPTAGRVIFNNLSKMPKLLSLTLNNEVRELDQKMGPQDALLLKNALKDNTTLQFLDVSTNDFGDEGAGYVGEMLQQNKGLKSLSIANNGITDTGAHKIFHALKNNSTLTFIDLTFNNIQERQKVEDELKQLPNLKSYKTDKPFTGSAQPINCAQQ